MASAMPCLGGEKREEKKRRKEEEGRRDSACNHAGIGGDAADIIDVGVAQIPQSLDCLPASGAAVSVDKQGDMGIVRQKTDPVYGLQRQVFAAGDMALTIFLRSTDIQ